MRIIAGEARGRPIVAPRGDETRPALDRTRESIFAILGDAAEGAAVLDLFAGSGAFGLEALSRGAHSALFIENSASAIRALERNLADLGFEGRATVLRTDALRNPAPADGESYELVFFDPPFALFGDPRTAARLASRVEEILAGLLAQGGTLVVRLPERQKIEIGVAPDDRRAFGASDVLFFSGGTR